MPVKTATALQAELSDSSLAPVIRVIKFTMGGVPVVTASSEYHTTDRFMHYSIVEALNVS